MDYDIVPKGKIENLLEIFIFLGKKKPKMKNAVEKWEKDLIFTDTYKIEDQRKIWLAGVKLK